MDTRAGKMNREGWRRVNTLFHRVRSADPAQREALLSAAAEVDSRLREEVETLLAADRQASHFLKSSAMEVAAKTMAAHEPPMQIGRKIGRYTILSLLGAGGMGEVYKARDMRLHRLVAMKLLPGDSTTDQDLIRRFHQEARAVSALNHPNIVTIFEIGCSAGTHFIVSEFIDGQTLRNRLRSGRLEMRQCLDIAIQTTEALSAAHQAGVIHRDIKPENIMLRRDGYVKVLDFGLAKLTRQFSRDLRQVETIPGKVVGTVRYMSPEQLLDQEVDVRTDIFSLGTVFYEMSAGHAPFERAGTLEEAGAILHEDAPPLELHFPAVPPAYARLVSRALAKNQVERYQSARDLLADLKSLQMEIAVQVRTSDNALVQSEKGFHSATGASDDQSTAPFPPSFPPLQLEPVGGALPLDSDFYIVRATDNEFHAAVERHDSIVLVKGARQIGKTSLLARGLQKARQAGGRVVLTDFQTLSSRSFESIDRLFSTLVELIAEQLGLDIAPSRKWNRSFSPGVNLERVLRREILAQVPSFLVWGLDEVDRLFSCEFGSEVFGIFRSWHNKRALDPEGPWRRLTLAMAYATEAHLFITDLNQSPFNVGTRLVLEDFSIEQVEELNRRYGCPLRTKADVSGFYRLVGGHPYLVSRGLHEMANHGADVKTLVARASQDEGPFGDHLRRMVTSAIQDPMLKDVLRGVLRGRPCPNSDSFYRLRSAGLISGDSANLVRPRCNLYATYLERFLDEQNGDNR